MATKRWFHGFLFVWYKTAKATCFKLLFESSKSCSVLLLLFNISTSFDTRVKKLIRKLLERKGASWIRLLQVSKRELWFYFFAQHSLEQNEKFHIIYHREKLCTQQQQQQQWWWFPVEQNMTNCTQKETLFLWLNIFIHQSGGHRRWF